ncbi:sperm microtubule inner protein 8 [Eudromia elegans]
MPGRRRLAAVKEDLYHPHLPSLRRMDMDTAACKLPECHARTSTRCTREDFARASFGLPPMPGPPLPSLALLHRWPPLAARAVASTVTPVPLARGWPSYVEVAQNWSRFVSAPAAPGLPGTGSRCSGYAGRSLRPEVTQTWRDCLQQDPSLHQYGPKPMPKSTYDVFRSFGPAYR